MRKFTKNYGNTFHTRILPSVAWSAGLQGVSLDWELSEVGWLQVSIVWYSMFSSSMILKYLSDEKWMPRFGTWMEIRVEG